jgi:hypothetical protein
MVVKQDKLGEEMAVEFCLRNISFILDEYVLLLWLHGPCSSASASLEDFFNIP